MSAAYTSRDIVEDFVRYKLLVSGLQGRSIPPPPDRRPAAQRRLNAAASSRRPGSAMTSHQEVHQEDTGPCWTPPPLQVVLRCACDELDRRYHGNLAAHVSLLLRRGGGAERGRSLTAVREELFRDAVNWGRIVALMELGGALCIQAVRRGGAWQVDDITRWMEESLESAALRGWMEDNGGWEAFVDLYGESRPPVGSWSWRTLLGLVVLGAAGITVGVLQFL